MYAVVEMIANTANPQAYGRFVKCRALIDDAFVGAYNRVCNLLGTDRPKMIHTTGVYGATNLIMALDEIEIEREVQLFREFDDPQRFWIFKMDPEKGDASPQ